MELFEKIDNLILLNGNLNHIKLEINNGKLSFFRIAREAHQALYRSMVEALRGSANLSITGRPKDKKRIVKYQIGNKPWQEIHKIKVEDCKFAWRFSDPEPCEEPSNNDENYEIPEMDNYLISFYDLLAMIQTECFMNRFTHSKHISVSDDEIRKLQWLHEAVRNEFEHFIPKLYSVFIPDLIKTSQISLSLSSKLIYESGNVMSTNIPTNLKTDLKYIFDTLALKEKHFEELKKKYNKVI